MKFTLNAKQYDDLVHMSDADPDEVRHNYSGRAMYGKEALAYTGDRPIQFAFELAAVLTPQEEFAAGDNPHPYAVYDDLRDTLGAIGEPRTDSMGLGTVYYWPNITVEGMED